MNWQNLDKIFIGNAEGFYSENHGYVDKEWIMENNPLYIERYITQPLSNGDMISLRKKELVRYYCDGRVERRYAYTSNNTKIDGISALNGFGAKVLRQRDREVNKIND